MKKIGLLGMVLVLCLAALGAGYAMWSETLTIDGTVSTGSVDVDMSVVSASDNEIESKNVSSVTADETATGVVINVNNAYPCITYTVVLSVTSTGTVPVHFTPWANTSNLPAGAMEVTCLEGVQLHEGNSATVVVTIHLTNEMLDGMVDDGMNTSFTIDLEALAHQYNEAP